MSRSMAQYNPGVTASVLSLLWGQQARQDHQKKHNYQLYGAVEEQGSVSVLAPQCSGAGQSPQLRASNSLHGAQPCGLQGSPPVPEAHLEGCARGVVLLRAAKGCPWDFSSPSWVWLGGQGAGGFPESSSGGHEKRTNT